MTLTVGRVVYRVTRNGIMEYLGLTLYLKISTDEVSFSERREQGWEKCGQVRCQRKHNFEVIGFLIFFFLMESGNFDDCML